MHQSLARRETTAFRSKQRRDLAEPVLLLALWKEHRVLLSAQSEVRETTSPTLVVERKQGPLG